MVKNPSANAGDTEMRIGSLDQEELLEEGMSTHASILAWRIPWTEEPGGARVRRVTKSWTQPKQLSTQGWWWWRRRDEGTKNDFCLFLG